MVLYQWFKSILRLLSEVDVYKRQKMDISQVFRLKRKKLATAKQKKIITLFNNLFSSGFHLVEIISFLGRSALLEKDYVAQMHQGLSQGKSFSEMMNSLGFSSAIAVSYTHLEKAWQDNQYAR